MGVCCSPKGVGLHEIVSLEANGPTQMLLDLSPPVQIDSFEISQGHVHVAREDLLPGGTKQRAIGPFLQELAKQGFKEFVYASPPSGFAQVALASTCQKLGFGCTLFCDDVKNGGLPSGQMHEFSRLASSFQANTYLVPNLELGEISAKVFASEREDRLKLPLGFGTPAYTAKFKKVLEEQWMRIKSMIGEPSEIWLPVGSATLSNVFRDLVPEHIPLHCVNVGVLPSDDERLVKLFERPNVHRYDAPELFAEVAQQPPPFPSNSYYDAKLWRFVYEHAADGALWWNVAR